MGGFNSKGGYRTTHENMMKAFDKLPQKAREALANAQFNYVPQVVRTRWNRQYKGYRNGTEIAATIKKWDANMIAKEQK